MSLAFGGAFQLSSQPDNEQSSIFKRAKLENGQNVVFGEQKQKRAVLGTITNNVRVQPSRAAKQASLNTFGSKNDENSLVQTGKSTFTIPPSSQQSFQIHVDSEPVLQSTRSNGVGLSSFGHGPDSALNPAVTSLSRAPLANVFVASKKEEIEESPMAVDFNSSCEEEVEVMSSSKENEIVNIDCGSEVDILDVTEYADEIYEYLKRAELKNRPKPGYMKKQSDINNSMRAILMDWLVEVADEYKLLPQTLYLTANYIDRFLSVMSVLRGKLQLVGTACMLLASKFEEIYPPEVADFVYITDETYTAKQVLKMEQIVLKALSFDLSVPTIIDFVHRFLKAACVPSTMAPKVGSLSRYLCELTLQDSDPYLKYLPSTIAASSVVLALHTFGLAPWTRTLAHYSGFEFHDLQACIHDLHRTFCHAPKHPQQAVREKYKDARFHSVSSITPPESVPVM